MPFSRRKLFFTTLTGAAATFSTRLYPFNKKKINNLIYDGLIRPLTRNIQNGIVPGNLMSIGARPSMGKTSYALNLALDLSKSGKNIGYFSYELLSTEISKFMLCIESNISQKTLRKGNIDAKKVGQSVHKLSSLPIYINDSSGADLFSIEKEVKENNIEVVLIDYFQLYPLSKKGGKNTIEQRNKLAYDLKALAVRLNISIVVLTQLNRKLEKREIKRPIISDIACQGLCEASDTVLFLFREEVYRIESHSNEFNLEVIVAKNRGSGTGSVIAHLDHETRKVSFV